MCIRSMSAKFAQLVFSVCSKTLSCCSGQVSAFIEGVWVKKKKKKKVCGLNTSQPVLKPVICACVLCHWHTLRSVVLVFSSQLGSHHTVSWSCMEQTWWWLLPITKKTAQGFFVVVEAAAVQMKNQFRTFLISYLPVTSNCGGQSWLMTRSCYDKSFQKPVLTWQSN